MICPNCGTELSTTNQKYCEFCGIELINVKDTSKEEVKVKFSANQFKKRCC